MYNVYVYLTPFHLNF